MHPITKSFLSKIKFTSSCAYLDYLMESSSSNAPFKRVLIVLLKLIGENITINNFNDLT